MKVRPHTLLAVAALGGIVALSACAPGATPKSAAQLVAPAGTYGMHKYTDARYGFSFWYPGAMAIEIEERRDRVNFPGGIERQTLHVGMRGGTEIIVVDSPAGTITDEPNHHASPIPQTKYAYDAESGGWLVSHPEGWAQSPAPQAPKPVTIRQRTIGGLAMLPSGRRFETTIIPLSPHRFLVVGNGGGSFFTRQLARTVTRAGASADPAAREAALVAEAKAYAKQQSGQ